MNRMQRKHRINATSVTSKILIEQKKTLEVDVLNFTERTRPFPLFFFFFFQNPYTARIHEDEEQI